MANTSMQEDSSLLDDDFGDFGGFEAADPGVSAASENVQQNTEAVTTAWAVMAAAAPSSSIQQTNVIDDQESVSHLGGADQPPEEQRNPSPVPTSSVCGSSGPSQVQAKVEDRVSEAIDWAAVGEDLDLDSDGGATGFKAVFGDQTTTESAEGSWASTALSEQLMGVSSESNQTALNTDKLTVSDSVSSGKENNRTGESMKPDDVPPLSDDGADHSASHDDVQDQFNELKDQHQIVLAEKVKVQKELEDLSKQNKVQQQEIEELQQRLTQQTQKYQDMQDRHQADLEDIRQAGHKTLAMMVEEYKEICKVAILQQQNDTQQAVKQALMEQAEQYKEVLKTQEKSFGEQMETFHKEVSERLAEVVKTQREEAETHIEDFKVAEVENTKKLLARTAQDCQETHRQLLQEAVQQERTTSQKANEQNQKSWQEELDNVRTHSKEVIAEAISEETEKCKVCIKEALSQEKLQQTEVLESLKSQARSDLKQYIEEHRQAEMRVRHRSLASVDFFLEGARQQIQLLLSPSSSEQDPESSPPVSKS